MLSVACLPLRQEEEGSQEEQEALYRRHAEVLWLSRLPAGRDPSLKPLGCVHHPLFRFNPCQGSYGFETNQCFNPFQGNYCFETPALPIP
jgi:hypothetical protein